MGTKVILGAQGHFRGLKVIMGALGHFMWLKVLLKAQGQFSILTFQDLTQSEHPRKTISTFSDLEDTMTSDQNSNPWP